MPKNVTSKITIRPINTCFFSDMKGLDLTTKSRTTRVETEFNTAIREVIKAAIKEANTKPLKPDGSKLFSNNTKVCFVSSPSSPGYNANAITPGRANIKPVKV